MRFFFSFLMVLILTGVVPSFAEKPETALPSLEKTTFEYSSFGRRDPFVPLVLKEEKLKPKTGAPPLESYDVSEMKVIAILWGERGTFAVVTVPDGKSYSIREGDRVGLSKGKVYKITKDSVIIREKKKDYRGAVHERDLPLKLRREEE